MQMERSTRESGKYMPRASVGDIHKLTNMQEDHQKGEAS